MATAVFWLWWVDGERPDGTSLAPPFTIPGMGIIAFGALRVVAFP